METDDFVVDIDPSRMDKYGKEHPICEYCGKELTQEEIRACNINSVDNGVCFDCTYDDLTEECSQASGVASGINGKIDSFPINSKEMEKQRLKESSEYQQAYKQIYEKIKSNDLAGILNEMALLEDYKDSSNTVVIEELANKIIELMKKYNATSDTRVYFNNKCIEDGTKVIDNISPENYMDYSNVDTITISFEGPMYDMMNSYDDNGFETEFTKLLADYGYYYELGNAWNLALYEM